MSLRARLFTFALILTSSLSGLAPVRGQQPAGDEPPPVPRGVEVLARGPVHEAFATLTAEPVAGKPVPKKAPQPLDEMPPDDKPDDDVIWISGYWHWDDDRDDFLWVSGVWRKPPPGKRWVAGYWREEGLGAVWVGGFWANDRDDDNEDVTYLPPPPPPPNVAAPGEAPATDTFYVPGHWVYRGTGYAWQAGYWAKVQPNYVWVSAHYRWTPSGYVYIPGYWDLAVARRGVLYAPVVVDVAVAGPAFVYTPAYVVRETVVLDSLFVRPSCCHYYFGDYYEVKYRDWGFESCVVYGRRCYDPIVVYERWDHRHDPHWDVVQINLFHDRCAGRVPPPPRTLVQQNIIVQKNVTNVHVHGSAVVVPAKQFAKAKGVATVPVDARAKAEVRQQAQKVQAVAQQRRQTEVAPPPTKSSPPRVATLNVPKASPLGAKAARVVASPPQTRTVPPNLASPAKNPEAKETPRQPIKPAGFSAPAPRPQPQPQPPQKPATPPAVQKPSPKPQMPMPKPPTRPQAKPEPQKKPAKPGNQPPGRLAK